MNRRQRCLLSSPMDCLMFSTSASASARMKCDAFYLLARRDAGLRRAMPNSLMGHASALMSCGSAPRAALGTPNQKPASNRL